MLIVDNFPPKVAILSFDQQDPMLNDIVLIIKFHSSALCNVYMHFQ
jgi:hypothetical protein